MKEVNDNAFLFKNSIIVSYLYHDELWNESFTFCNFFKHSDM